MASMHIKRGDTVAVITGRDRGKQGKVLEIDRETGRARVEGVMVVKRHLRKGASQTAPEGGIIEKNATVHVSNLMLVDPKTGEPTRVGRKIEDGKKIRYAKKSGESLD